MKFTIEIEAEPDEVRRALGMPNLEPMQNRLLDQIEEQVARNLKLMDPEAIARLAIPMAGQGVEQIQGLLQNALRSVRRNKSDDEG